MAEIPNLTDKIAELREHKGARSLRHDPWKPAHPPAAPPETDAPERQAERPIARNPLASLIYASAGFAFLAEIALILFLDLI